jgi:hypothetical protein
VLAFALAIVLLGCAAWLVATMVFPGEMVASLLAFWLLAFAEVVALCFLLSLAGWLTRGGLLVVLACVLVPVAIVARRTRRGRFPLRAGLRALRRAFADPLVAALAIIVALALSYALALGIGTPANDWDSLIYHLPRAVLWAQQGSVGYLDGATDLRLNAMPPNAEIVSLFTMLTADSDRFVALAQFSAVVIGGVCVFGIGRRLGLEPGQALFGGLLFAALPVLLLQAGTALNDVVVATLLAATTYFALGTRRVDAVFAGLALALAAGTKFTTLLALPLLAAVVAAGQPRRLWPRLALALTVGFGAGSYWYVVNLVETGKLDGGIAGAFAQVPDRSVGGVLLRTYQLSADLLELPGTLGRGRWIYPLVGLVVLLAAVAAIALRRRSLGLVLAPAACAVTVTPFVFEAAGRLAPYPAKALLELVGAGHLSGEAVAPGDRNWSEPFGTGYGAVGVILLLAALVFAIWQLRRPRRPAGALPLALAIAPVLFIPLFAWSVIYDGQRSRFLAFPVALSAGLWGYALPRRALATTLVALCGVTCFATLAFATFKPSGVQLLFPRDDSWSVWSASRWEVVDAGGHTSSSASRFVDENVPPGATVALALESNKALYAYVRALSREVRLVPPGTGPPREAEWLVVSAGRREEVDPRVASGWQVALTTADDWRVYRRAG